MQQHYYIISLFSLPSLFLPSFFSPTFLFPQNMKLLRGVYLFIFLPMAYRWLWLYLKLCQNLTTSISTQKRSNSLSSKTKMFLTILTRWKYFFFPLSIWMYFGLILNRSNVSIDRLHDFFCGLETYLRATSLKALPSL